MKLYDALRDQLDGSWDVYHSTSWTERRGAQGSRDGEIDFVVAHPEEGVLCIEAKGGAVKLEDGRWMRKEQGGNGSPTRRTRSPRRSTTRRASTA